MKPSEIEKEFLKQIVPIMKDAGYSHLEDGCFEKEISEGFFIFFNTTTELSQANSSFYVNVGIANIKVDSIIKTVFSNSKSRIRHGLINCRLGDFMQPPTGFQKWYGKDIKELVKGFNEALKIFKNCAEKDLNNLKNFRAIADYLEMEKPFPSFSDPLVYAFLGNFDSAESLIKSNYLESMAYKEIGEKLLLQVELIKSYEQF